MSYQCPACGQRFSTVGNFDKHRVGSFIDHPPDYGRRCLTPKELECRGLKLNRRGVWVSATPRPETLKHTLQPRARRRTGVFSVGAGQGAVRGKNAL